MAKSEPMRGLVVGCGHMGAIHARVLSSVDGVEVVGVVDSDATRVGASQAATNAVGYASLADALAGARADFACLAVPVPSLVEAATACIEAGLPVLIEKPMASSEEDARRLVALAAQRDVMLAVGYVERFNPAVRELARRLAEGAIGRVYQVHARRLSPFPARSSMLGVALDLATHDIDVIRYITGDEVERVFAETAQRVHEGAEDLICATLRLDSGITALLEINWLTPTKVRQLSVTGEGGMFVVDYLSQDLHFFENPRASTEWDTLTDLRGVGEGDMVRYALNRREPLRVEWEEFLAALRSGRQPAVRGEDAVAALSTALAIQRSGLSQQVVRPRYRGDGA